jgi:regulatory protein
METYKTHSLAEATQKLKRYCAYRERCHMEVENKLRELRMIPQARAEIIRILIKEGFLNEERFAKAFARGKFNINKWGKIRIVRELKKRDISKYNIESALKEINNREYQQVFQEIASKKLKSIKDKNPFKKKKKLVDYLLFKGFEAEMVYEKTNSI